MRKKGEMTPSKNKAVIQCANCKNPLTESQKNISKITESWSFMKDSTCISRRNDISICEAISYIFGLPDGYFQKQLISILLKENSKDSILPVVTSNFDETVLMFCEECGPILCELYKISKLLRNVSVKDALIWRVLEKHGFDAHFEKNLQNVIKLEPCLNQNNLDENLMLEHMQDVDNENLGTDVIYIKSEIEIDENSKDDSSEIVSENEENLLIQSAPAKATGASKINNFGLKTLFVSIKKLPENYKKATENQADELQNDVYESVNDAQLSDGNFSPTEESSSSDDEFFTRTRTSKRLKTLVKSPRVKAKRKGGCGLLKFKENYIKIASTNETSGKPNYKFKCKRCWIICGSRSNFNDHYVSEHFDGASVYKEVIKGPPFKCPKCDAVYKALNTLSIHAADKHDLKLVGRQRIRQKPKGIIKCEDCGVGFSTSQGFLLHQSKVHNRQYHTCPICAEVFPFQSDLDSHKESQHLGKSAQPDNAKTKRKRGGGLLNFKENYIKIASSNKESSELKAKFKCKRCGITCGSRSRFNDHYVNKHFDAASVHEEIIKGPPFKCPKCDAVYKAINTLAIHAADKHDLKIVGRQRVRQKPKDGMNCNDCGVNFSSSQGFVIHQANKHNRKYYNCLICAEVFPLKSELDSHKAAQHRKPRRKAKSEKKLQPPVIKNEADTEYSKDLYYCRECAYKFTTRMSHGTHQRKTHNGRQKFDCKNCDESFVFLISFLLHMANVHKEVFKPENYKYQYTCKEPNCGLFFYETDAIKRHQKNTTHSGFEVTCAFCEESFSDMRSMEIHNRDVHNNKRVCKGAIDSVIRYQVIYQCNSCQVVIANNTEMADHKLIHQDVVKIYTCAVCQKPCSSYHQWLQHSLRHKKTSFQCDRCGKNFQDLRIYRLHCRIHAEKVSGIRPLCEMCGKSFSNGKSLNKHKGTIHFRKTECVCNSCGHTCKTNWHLKLHMKVHAKNGSIKT